LATFKIVKAHHFLRPDGSDHGHSDGRVLIFDEAQRTYKKGRRVLNHVLRENEAELILESQERAFPDGGIVVVALVGHNQAINSGELGVEAWLDAADKRKWTFALAEDSIPGASLEDPEKWRSHHARTQLKSCHLSHSMRFYRNASLEKWASAVLEDEPAEALALANGLEREGHTVWLTRLLDVARKWTRRHVVGEERAGIIASSQARRLSAHGLFVDQKPPIENWMLAASTDIRSSSMLETVQNQYQVQGLELDHAIVCWDLDLRRDESSWTSHKVKGDDWQRFDNLAVAKNGYRVLLTRARKGMVIFVPPGDPDGVDLTRPSSSYDEIANHLKKCGAKDLLPS